VNELVRIRKSSWLWYTPRNTEADYEKPKSGYPAYQSRFKSNIHSFIHVHMIYSRHHNGLCDMEQVKICIEWIWYM